LDNSKFKKTLNRITLLIGLGLLGHSIYLLFTIDKEMLGMLKNVNAKYIFFIALLPIIPSLIHAIRINIWSRFLGYNLSYKDSFRVVLANDIGSAISPNIIGGGPFKIGMLNFFNVSLSDATLITLISTFEDLLFFAFGFVLTIFYMNQDIQIMGDVLSKYKMMISVFILVCILSIFFRKKLKTLIKKILSLLLPNKALNKLHDFKSNLRLYFSSMSVAIKKILKDGKVRFLASIGLLFLQWLTKFSILALILKGLNINFDYFSVVIKQWMIWLTILFAPTPGGAGGAEITFLLLFTGVFSNQFIHLLVSIWRFFTYYFILILSVIIFNLLSIQRKKKES
jgi:glycosyltransferase 2 family protein